MPYVAVFIYTFLYAVWLQQYIYGKTHDLKCIIEIAFENRTVSTEIGYQQPVAIGLSNIFHRSTLILT